MRNFKPYTTALLLFTLPLSSIETPPSPTYTDIVSFLNLIESGALKNVITEPEDLAQITYFLTTLTLAGALPEEEPLLEEELRTLLASVHLAQSSYYFGAKTLDDWKILLCRNFIEKAWDQISSHISEHKTTYLWVGGAALGLSLLLCTGGSAAPALSFLGGSAGAIAGKLGSDSLNSVPAYEQIRKIEPAARTELVQAIRGPSKGIQDPEIIRHRAVSFAHKGLRAISGEKTLFQKKSPWLSSLNQQFSSLNQQEKAEAVGNAWNNLDRFLEPNLEHHPLPFKRMRVPIQKYPPELSPPDGLNFLDSVDILYIELPPNTTQYAGKKGLMPPVETLHPDVQRGLQKRRAAGHQGAESFFSSFFTSPLKWHDSTPYDRELLKECIREADEETGKKHVENVSLSFAVKVGTYESPKISVFFINGMVTNDIETQEMMSLISNLLGGLIVAGCHNATAGLILDGAEAGLGKLGVPLEINEQTCIAISDELARIGPDGRMFVIAHSQGGLIFYEATKSLEKAVRKQMDVNTLGTAKVVPSEDYRRSNNLIAEDDGVAKGVNFLYFVGLLPKNDITILEPVEGSTGHPFMSPTYQEALEDIAKSIKAHERERNGSLEGAKLTEYNAIAHSIEKPSTEQHVEAGKWDK